MEVDQSTLERFTLNAETYGIDLVLLVDAYEIPPYTGTPGPLITKAIFSNRLKEGVPIDFSSIKEDQLSFAIYQLLELGFNALRPNFRFIIRKLSHIGESEDLKRLIDQIEALSIIMPHVGPEAYLRDALHSIVAGTNGQVSIQVSLDDAYSDAFCKEINQVADALYYTRPLRVGPYYQRLELMKRSVEAGFKLISFHDSDDISTYDRFAIQSAALRTSSSEIIGCHEVQKDEINQVLRTVIFPLNVHQALDIKPAYAQLFPTMLCKASKMLLDIGLSSDFAFGADTQFLLRAYFFCINWNIDRFLYVRRIHRTSLTQNPKTKIGSPQRLQLDQQWKDA
ncbi:MAG: hypothetical protein AAF633_14045, partial [Chloroflexota bacterium]